jgi:hypothetical protein
MTAISIVISAVSRRADSTDILKDSLTSAQDGKVESRHFIVVVDTVICVSRDAPWRD